MFRSIVVPLAFPLKKARKLFLHSFFCPVPIDLVLLTYRGKVIELKESWQTKFYCSREKANVLLELPSGSIKNRNIKVGDMLNIIKRV